MPAPFVDVWNELVDLDREAAHLSHALARHGSNDEADAQNIWEQTHVRASAVEKLYSGCERIMARLATEVDGVPVTHSDGWHAALLKRLAHPFPEVRDAIISEDCYRRLDRLRSFRHRERNSYGFDLDPQTVVERAGEAVETIRVFHNEMRSFISQRGFKPDDPT